MRDPIVLLCEGDPGGLSIFVMLKSHFRDASLAFCQSRFNLCTTVSYLNLYLPADWAVRFASLSVGVLPDKTCSVSVRSVLIGERHKGCVVEGDNFDSVLEGSR